MAKNNINDSGLKKILSYLVLCSQFGSLLDDLNISTDKTYSSKAIEDRIKNASDEDRLYVDRIIGSLNKLSSETTTTIPQPDTANANTLYLYSQDPNPTSYHQYLVLSNKEIIDLGDTSIDLTSYLKSDEAENIYQKKIDAHSHSNKSTIDNLTQNVIDNINNLNIEVDGVSYTQDVDGKIALPNYPTPRTDDEIKTLADGQINAKMTTTIDSTSTDTQIPSAKSVYDKYNIHDKSEAYSNIITNPLLADAVNPNSIYNKDGIVSRDTTENLDTFKLPIDCSWGIREIFWKSAGNLVSKITGMDLNNKPGTWINVLRGDENTYEWSGWYRLCATKVAYVAPYKYTSFETSTLTGTIQVEVKNGICTISGYPLVSNATGLGIPVLKNMPMPTGTRTAPIVVDTNGEIVGMIYIDEGTTNLNAHFYKTGGGYFVLSYPVAES